MEIEFSTWSIMRVILVLLGFWLLWQVKAILALVFIVLIVVAALAPTIDWLVSRRVPRPAAVTLMLAIVLGSFVAILSLVVPAIIAQLQTFLTDQVPGILTRVAVFYPNATTSRQVLSEILQQLQSISGDIVSGAVTVFGGVVSFLTVIALSFYLLLDEHALRRAALGIAPVAYRDQIESSFTRVTEKLGSWLRGQFALSVIIGLTVSISVTLIGLPIPLALGLFAGLFEIIPIIGPLVSGAMIVIMAAVAPGTSVVRILLALGVFTLIQLLESHFLVPNIMKKAIGLSPVLVILALLVGDRLGGISGAVLAVPLAAVAQVALEDWPKFQATHKRTSLAK